MPNRRFLPGVTANTALDLLREDQPGEPDRYPGLRAFLAGRAPKGKALPTSRGLGDMLKRWRGRVASGRRLDRRSAAGGIAGYSSVRSHVDRHPKRIPESGVGQWVLSGSLYPPFTREEENQNNTSKGNQTHSDPLTHSDGQVEAFLAGSPEFLIVPLEKGLLLARTVSASRSMEAICDRR